MFQMPVEYYLNREFAVKSIIPKDLKPNDKKRMRENIKKVTLEWQLNGEAVPSRVDDDINCQVIMFFSIELTNIKHAAFLAKILQEELKGFVILKMFDSTTEVYSFALKRLHAVQKDEVVVEELYLSNAVPRVITHIDKQLLIKFTNFDLVHNKLDKYNYYVELAAKVYIITHSKTYAQFKEFLYHNTLWLNKELVQRLLSAYIVLVNLKKIATQQLKTNDKIEVNSKIKEQLNELNRLMEV